MFRFGLLLFATVPAIAQTAPPPPAPLTAAGARAAENAVRQAGDAFGTVIGREEIGLYSAGQVRGFSPVDAGNVRIAGLYFDPVVFPSDRISGATLIRVGPSALGSPFPAPTGIVDLGLRLPGDAAGASLLVSGDSWGSSGVELDAALPVAEGFSLGFGGAAGVTRFFNATRADNAEAAIIARIAPSPDFELVPFVSFAFTPLDDNGVTYLPAGEVLPPRLPRSLFVGPFWARSRGTELLAGSVGLWRPAAGWELRAGLFHAVDDSQRAFSNLMAGVTPDGSGRQLILADPALRTASTSGEVRLSRSFADGPRRHSLHLSLRGRSSERRFGGQDEADLGPTTLTTILAVPRPDFRFGTPERDRVRQWNAGLAYEGRWDGVGELSAGLSRADYAKRITIPGIGPVANDATPLLWNLNAALNVAAGLSVYGGHVTGLEESGVAPANASNRNEALPAIRTRQTDLGLRWQVAPGVSLLAGGFEVSKPYFNLDAAGRFDMLGDVRNRGIEASVSGPVTRHLSVVAGAVLAWPRVTGEAVALGRVGPRPVGAISRRIEASADWRPPFAPGLSLDVNLSHRSPETATVSNLVAIPARTLVDLGGRYAMRLGDTPATLRVQVANLFDAQGFDLRGTGAYAALPGRVVSGYLTVDF